MATHEGQPLKSSSIDIGALPMPPVETLWVQNAKDERLEAAIYRGYHDFTEADEPREVFDARLEYNVPGVLIIPGIPKGGRNNKSETLLSPMFQLYVKHLADLGVNSMLMNAAGMGRSEGNTSLESLNSLTNNWVAAAEELVAHTNTDRWQIRLLGNSMGGHVAGSLIERLEQHGMAVDRVALVSPSFYPKIAQKAKFGHTFPLARRHFIEFWNLPSYNALNRYAGRLLISFSHHDSPPIHPEEMAVAGDAVAAAIREGRGLSFFSLFVKHNFAPLNKSDQAQLDVDKTMAESAAVITNFLGH